MREDLLKNEDYKTKEIHLPLQIVGIDIEDAREDVTPGDLKVPVFALPGDHAHSAPALSAAQQKFLIEETTNYFNGDSKSGEVAVHIKLYSATKDYQAKLLSGERESSTADVEVDLLDPEAHALLAYGRGTGQFWMRSYIATNSSSERAYQKAMSIALYKAMEALASEVPQLPESAPSHRHP